MQRTTYKIREKRQYKHHAAKAQIELHKITGEAQRRKRISSEIKTKNSDEIGKKAEAAKLSRLIEKNPEPPRELALSRNDREISEITIITDEKPTRRKRKTEMETQTENGNMP